MRIREAELQAEQVVQRAEQEARRVRRLQRAQRGTPLLLERVEAGDRLRRAGAAAVTAAAAARAFEAQSLAPQRLPMPIPMSAREFEALSIEQLRQAGSSEQGVVEPRVDPDADEEAEEEDELDTAGDDDVTS